MTGIDHRALAAFRARQQAVGEAWPIYLGLVEWCELAARRSVPLAAAGVVPLAEIYARLTMDGLQALIEHGFLRLVHEGFQIIGFDGDDQQRML